MAPDQSDLIDLNDLKMLPAWVKQPAGTDYSSYSGEQNRRAPQTGPGSRAAENRMRKVGPRSNRHRQRRRDQPRPAKEHQRPPEPQLLPAELTVQFRPQARALENVIVQIRAGALAYSLFSLARLFLERPQRYCVRLTAKAESPLFQLEDGGPISLDRLFLERNAFRFMQRDFYSIETRQTDPIKGNFTSVARDRLSGTLLGPTNHHGYQPRLRSLYEQRFSPRMSFADYQRQIEIVSDPTLVEQWKEEARTITNYTTLGEEPSLTFNGVAEAERHFRKAYLPGLVRTIEGTIIDGVTSRQMPDRILRRVVENAWTAQNCSPSQMMQELATRFREAGLHIFRHRRGMLFVSPIRVRAFAHEQASVSPQVQAILEAIAENERTNRKALADKLIVDLPQEEAESRKLALAADLRWLVDEGYVIEFNDGSLDRPRTRKVAQASGLQNKRIANEPLALS
jgi:hypothetical protein